MSKIYPLRLFAGSTNRVLAEEIAQNLGVSLGKSTTERLPDSEIHVQVDELVRDQDIFLFQSFSPPVNDSLVELLFYLDAFRRASVHSITVIIPYFPYARQERMSTGREAISARVVASMLEALGASRVIYMDIHAPATQGFFDIPVDPLTALPIFVEYFEKLNLPNQAIVSADVGRAKLAGSEATHVVGDIEGHTPIVIDDIIASGSVLTQLGALLEKGARPEMYVAITHPVLLPKALQRLDEMDYIKQLVVTNTIYVPPEKRHPKLKVLSVAPLLANVIRRIHEGKSVSPLLRLT